MGFTGLIILIGLFCVGGIMILGWDAFAETVQGIFDKSGGYVEGAYVELHEQVTTP